MAVRQKEKANNNNWFIKCDHQKLFNDIPATYGCDKLICSIHTHTPPRTPPLSAPVPLPTPTPFPTFQIHNQHSTHTVTLTGPDKRDVAQRSVMTRTNNKLGASVDAGLNGPQLAGLQSKDFISDHSCGVTSSNLETPKTRVTIHVWMGLAGWGTS